jgi:HIRAN domain
MNHLYVASQNADTREWVPVAELREVSDGYELRYISGARRLPGFSGLSRMQAFDKVYYSKSLFPFFANRLIPKSRPEYRSYLQWLGLESMPASPLEVLAITGGARATDNYEIVAPPRMTDGGIEFNFFPRGLRYLSASALEELMDLEQGSPVYIVKDVQNPHDPGALALRREKPYPALIGYVPRYYAPGVHRLLDGPSSTLHCIVKRVNPDAPIDMKLLVSMSAAPPAGFELFSDVDDFLPLASSQTQRLSVEALNRTDLNI